jgi:hypothetical protein
MLALQPQYLPKPGGDTATFQKHDGKVGVKFDKYYASYAFRLCYYRLSSNI